MQARIIAQLESEEEILSSLTMCEQPEAQQETEEIKSTSSKKLSHLASWIDEFCQGTDWDREEAIFIPF